MTFASMTLDEDDKLKSKYLTLSSETNSNTVFMSYEGFNYGIRKDELIEIISKL